MSNDPTPEAVEAALATIHKFLGESVDVVQHFFDKDDPDSVVSLADAKQRVELLDLVGAAFRGLRTKLAEVEAALADSEYRRVKEGSELAILRQQLANAKDGQDAWIAVSGKLFLHPLFKSVPEVTGKGAALWIVDQLIQQLADANAARDQMQKERDHHRKEAMDYGLMIGKQLYKEDQLRAALTSQQEAMDTAVRRLDVLERLGETALSQLRASRDASGGALRAVDRAAQLPENGTAADLFAAVEEVFRDHYSASRANISEDDKARNLNRLFQVAGLIEAPPTAKTDGEAK